MPRKLFLLFACCAFLAGAAGAQDGSKLTSLVTGDDSRGWEAVGRLDIGHNGFCTASMIADDLVLTAAHCLFDPDTSLPIDPSEIEFLAGWRNGRATAYRGIRRAIPHPDYRFGQKEGASSVDRDIALLQLDSPIRKNGITPYGTADRPLKGDAVGVVSYAHNRAERPSIERACQVLARPSDSLILSCTVDFGASGSPIFTLEGGTPRIVSVVSAKGNVRGRPVSLGSGLEKPLADLRALIARDDGVFTTPHTTVRRIELEEARGTSGAKFLRP